MKKIKMVEKYKKLDFIIQNFITKLLQKKDIIFPNKKFIRLVTEGIKRECNASEIIEYSNKWKADYEHQGYRIISREKYMI